MTVDKSTHAGLFAGPRIRKENLPGGGVVLRSEVQLPPLPRSTGEWLRRWAAGAPERVFLAEGVAGGGGGRVGYRGTYASARGIGPGLLGRGGRPHPPLVVPSGNTTVHR